MHGDICSECLGSCPRLQLPFHVTELLLLYARADNGYTTEEIEYFLRIALGSEFAYSADRIRKWASDVRIGVWGEPTAEDILTLSSVVGEINAIIDGVLITY